MNHEQILAKMREGQIPRHTYDNSLKLEKQTKLHEIIEAKEYVTDAGLTSYLLRSDTTKGRAKVSRVAAVFAKELVLRGQKVFYAGVAGMASAMRMNDRGLEHYYSIYDRLGSGYIVIGDLGDAVMHLPPADWEVVQDFLLSHMGRGGGLVFGLTTSEGAITSDLTDALAKFVTVLVN